MDNSSAEQNENHDMTQSITSIPDKESIEDRYNKLRGFAVKLKKKVGDLTEQIQNLESDKQKLISEKDDMHNKIVQITESAKTVQTIQIEYDKLQDALELCKVDNKKLMKTVETLVSQNASLKENVFEGKDTVSSQTAQIKQLNKERANLESTNKQFMEDVKKLKNEIKALKVIREQKDKEYEEMKTNLEAEISGHKSTKSQLDALKQERATNNVLSLEVENYEKSIKEMKAKCAEEISKREAAEKSVEKHVEQISELNNQIAELRDISCEKQKKITVLQEENETVKEKRQKLKDEMKEMQTKINELVKQSKVAEKKNKELSETVEKLQCEKTELTREKDFSKENNEKLIKDLTSEVANLNRLLELSKQETETLRQDFEGYKLRAQSVLRTKESNKSSCSKGKSMIELEEELEHAQFQIDMWKEKYENYQQKVESLTSDLAIMKEEKEHALENRKELNEKLVNLRQEYRLLMEQNKTQETKIQQMHVEQKKEIEQLHDHYKAEINELKELHQSELLAFKSDYEKAINKSTKNELNYSTEKPIMVYQDFNFSNRLPAPLIEREECEGSESIDSASQTAMQDERHRRHSLIPLDELLNSSDDFESIERRTLPNKVSRQEFEVCEQRIKHLTVLLADAERDIAKLTQQNELLKEDIRRQQRSVEREEHANNFEYLKNVVFKFVTLKNGDERSHLIPVLTTILKLSPDEIHKLNAVAGVAGKSWLPGIPGWHSS